MVLVKKGLSVESWHKTSSKLRQIQALFPQRSCYIAWERAAFVISNPLQTKRRPPEQCQWISVCMHACKHFAFQLQNSGWHIQLLLTKLSALLAQNTTKSHHYLDYIIGPPTHAACPRYKDLDVYTSQTLESVHSSAVWVISKKEYRCMMLVWKESVHVYSMSFPAAPVVRPLTGSDVG